MSGNLFNFATTDDSSENIKIGLLKQFTFRGNVKEGRHGWLRLTPAYSLHVVKDILNSVSPDELVLEPFSGTGTTPLVCANSGIECHAIDINPFLVWLGNVKLHSYSDDLIKIFIQTALSIAKNKGAVCSRDLERIPPIHQIEKWWDKKVLNDLAHLCSTIQSLEGSDEHIKNLLCIVFCRTLIDAANVSFGHQSMSFKTQQKKEAQNAFYDSKPDVYFLFQKYSREIASSLTDPPIVNTKCKVVEGDAKFIDRVAPSKKYTRVITSPPYPNRMSYIRELRPYMYWLGYLTNGKQAGEMDWGTIGGTWGCATSLLGKWAPESDVEIPYRQFTSIVEAITEKNPLLGKYVHKYFVDMYIHFTNLHKILTKNATCHYIIGNSKFFDVIVPSEEIYASILEKCGFENVSVRVLRKRTSKKQLYEFLVEAKRI